MVKKIQLGSANGLHVVLLPLATSSQYGAGLAWGKLELWLGGTLVWYQQEEGSNNTVPVVWTWVDLLQGLARIWPWLTLEEGYPIAITPEHPGRLMDEAAQRWQDMAEGQAEAEEDVLYDFRQRHDLSLLLRGVYLPALWVLREGRECVLWSPAVAHAVRRPHAEVMGTLEELGQALAAHLEASNEPRAITAIARWNQRKAMVDSHLITVSSGLEAEEIAELTGMKNPEMSEIYRFFEIDPDTIGLSSNSELLMAARMTAGYVTPANQRVLLNEIRNIALHNTPKLDELSRSAPEVIQPGVPGYQQGYALANWLRSQLNMQPDHAPDPEQLLAQWGVALKDCDISAAIDAVAVWCVRHGPAVLPNKNGKSRASTRNGYRITLAHEMCHLLVDRNRSLPAAEVLGGQSPKLAEKRANAFAAEFLLPREQAAAACLNAPEVLQAAGWLEQQFSVSREVVCHQIRNSSFETNISSIDQKRLDRWRNWA